MFGRFLHRIFGNIAHNEQVIDKLAESKAIKRAAQVTAYYMVKASNTAQRKLIEYERSSDGFKKIKDALKTIQEESNKKRIN
ncbi:hypothetical protein BpHYR1_052075 [Brachionus plicatilis]|uniref:Uncharacterized protein n=1 Tax=Brachionus plicatilis TaxID=10195 RepID=A0A3M7R882_BRAPC|nr:hypothetical protein BpHYR1_052075 [Brachionus plicatilis]